MEATPFMDRINIAARELLSNRNADQEDSFRETVMGQWIEANGMDVDEFAEAFLRIVAELAIRQPEITRLRPEMVLSLICTGFFLGYESRKQDEFAEKMEGTL